MILFTTLRNKAAKTSRFCMTVLLTQLNNKNAINAIKTKKRSNAVNRWVVVLEVGRTGVYVIYFLRGEGLERR